MGNFIACFVIHGIDKWVGLFVSFLIFFKLFNQTGHGWFSLTCTLVMLQKTEHVEWKEDWFENVSGHSALGHKDLGLSLTKKFLVD